MVFHNGICFCMVWNITTYIPCISIQMNESATLWIVRYRLEVNKIVLLLSRSVSTGVFSPHDADAVWYKIYLPSKWIQIFLPSSYMQYWNIFKESTGWYNPCQLSWFHQPSLPSLESLEILTKKWQTFLNTLIVAPGKILLCCHQHPEVWQHINGKWIAVQSTEYLAEEKNMYHNTKFIADETWHTAILAVPRSLLGPRTL